MILHRGIVFENPEPSKRGVKYSSVGVFLKGGRYYSLGSSPKRKNSH